MISRQEFPYLQQLVINDAYAVKNLTIPVFERGEDFKHLILTGKNGSGKTTVLKAIMDVIVHDANNSDNASEVVPLLKDMIDGGRHNKERVDRFKDELRKINTVNPVFYLFNQKKYRGFSGISHELIIAYFAATRKINVKEVKTITREDDFSDKNTAIDADGQSANSFKQYIVNKKIYQVFDAMEGRSDGAKQQGKFFEQLEGLLIKIFEDLGAKLEFVRENFEFYINLSDGRRFTFNELSAGFSAFLSILTELLMRTDLLRKQANDYTYDPCGFVLIDEPETHLHLEMQYQILPLLTNLFPNLQFIVATHSPAVASSITGATVFDLSTGEVLGDQAAGSSYSELMQTHFGVENEYSNVADAILAEVDEIRSLPDQAQALVQLQRLMEEKGKYMSPVLQLDIQAQILHLKRAQAV